MPTFSFMATDMNGSCYQLNPSKILTTASSCGVHLKMDTVSTSPFILFLPLDCLFDIVDGGNGERRGVCSRTITLPKQYSKREIKEVDWNRGVCIPYFF